VRLFVAINLPDSEKHRLHEAVSRAIDPDLPVRWVDADSLHITLKFLGEVSDSQVAQLEQALRAAVARHAKFDVAVHDLGAFPSLSRPNIFWVGTNNPPELATLQQSVDAECANVGFAREHRPFRAHITVGRARKHAVIRDRTLMDRIVTGFRYKEVIRVESADLMRSYLGPRGARYDVVARMKLN
jgi:RNA 2',3'-cyclic 3'-phosphodiesterase